MNLYLIELWRSEMKDNLLLVLKGYIMGIANIIPGVSGGTLAIILGIYERFIGAISHFFSNLKENVKFLIPIAIGMVLAIVTLSRIIDYSYDHFPIPTCLFFVGLVLGGIPMLVSKVKGKEESKHISSYIIFMITFAVVIIVACSKLLFNLDMTVNLSKLSMLGYLLLFLVGMIAAATMIIPGVSGSLVLMMLGYYYPIINLIKQLTQFKDLYHNMLVATTFGIGVLLGIILISKLIEFLFKKYEVKTYFGVLGFIFASVIAIPISTYLEVKNLIVDVPQIIIGLIVMLIGIAISYKLGDQ